MLPQFNILYFLENTDIVVLELKRTDLPSNAPVSNQFIWLKIDKQTMEITLLNFGSKDSSGEIEERFFEQGYLKFNAVDGTFIEKYNSAQHPLSRRMAYRMSTEMKNAILGFLED